MNKILYVWNGPLHLILLYLAIRQSKRPISGLWTNDLSNTSYRQLIQNHSAREGWHGTFKDLWFNPVNSDSRNEPTDNWNMGQKEKIWHFLKPEAILTESRATKNNICRNRHHLKSSLSHYSLVARVMRDDFMIGYYTLPQQIACMQLNATWYMVLNNKTKRLKRPWLTESCHHGYSTILRESGCQNFFPHLLRR